MPLRLAYPQLGTALAATLAVLCMVNAAIVFVEKGADVEPQQTSGLCPEGSSEGLNDATTSATLRSDASSSSSARARARASASASGGDVAGSAASSSDNRQPSSVSSNGSGNGSANGNGNGQHPAALVMATGGNAALPEGTQVPSDTVVPPSERAKGAGDPVKLAAAFVWAMSDISGGKTKRG